MVGWELFGIKEIGLEIDHTHSSLVKVQVIPNHQSDAAMLMLNRTLGCIVVPSEFCASVVARN